MTFFAYAVRVTTNAVSRPTNGVFTRRTGVRSLVAGLALGVLTVAVPVVAPNSAAAAESCVTRAEFRKVKKGNTQMRVHDVFDFRGRVLFSNPGKQRNEAREYRMCSSWTKATGHQQVQVQYNNYATKGGPLRLVYKQHY